jgi:hypothetical protein
MKGKSPLGRPRLRLVDNIYIYISERGWRRIDWIDLAQDTHQWRALLTRKQNFGLHNMLEISRVDANWMLLKKGSATGS